MATRLNHVLNLLTADNQYAYKTKKPTIDILSATNNQTKGEGATQLILFDFSQAFGNIERDILWTKLYGSGLPKRYVQQLKMGHDGNKLLPKCEGFIGKQEANNKGALQGSPLSATLFIIYDEQMMMQYNKNLPEHKRKCRN